MILTRNDIRNYASKLLAFLEERKIRESKDLVSRINTVYPLSLKERVEIVKNRLKSGLPVSIKLRYIHEGVKIPLELSLNSEAMYVLSIIKLNELIPGYIQFTYPFSPRDNFGNIIQEKQIRPGNMADLLNEVRLLSS